MKFSIIVPVYNVEKYLPSCVSSILEQTFEDYEVILIDDGSSDGSEKLCDLYAQQSSKIRAIHQKNKGLSAARNRGVEDSNGEYLLFLDSDDYYADRHCLEDIAKCANNCDIVVFDWMTLDEKTGQKFSGEGQTQGLEVYYKNGIQYLQEALKKNPLYRWYAVIYAYRSKYWKAQHFQFCEGINFEDLDIVYRVILIAQGIWIIPKEFYVYRINRDGSTTKDVSSNSMIDKLKVVQNNIRSVQQNKQISKALKQMLCHNFAVCYCSVVEYWNYVPNKEKKSVAEEIAIASWVGNYLTDDTFKLLNAIINLLGIQFASKLLRLRKALTALNRSKINWRIS